jgi:outer membrane protein
VLKMCRTMLVPMLLLVAGSAFAEMKIAVINVQRAIGDTDEAKALLTKLHADYKKDEDALRALNTEITQLQEKFVKDGDVMSDTEKGKMQKTVEDKQRDLQFQADKLQRIFQEKQQDLLGQMGPKLEAVLKDIVAKDKYNMIVHKQNVIYSDPQYDITAQVTEALNQKK